MTELRYTAAQPPAPLIEDCAVPQNLGKVALSAGETERKWAADRANLSHCGVIHKQLRDFYNKRDAKLSLTN